MTLREGALLGTLAKKINHGEQIQGIFKKVFNL
jgi:uncharacterized membrane protein YeaQ/YmgE (transglycosylase-associated protein family)